MAVNMYYLPDHAARCGFYECRNCRARFLDVKIAPRMVCPDCGKFPDMEIGPDEEMPAIREDAVLLQVIEGEEECERYDKLLSLAVTGGDYDWL